MAPGKVMRKGRLMATGERMQTDNSRPHPLIQTSRNRCRRHASVIHFYFEHISSDQFPLYICDSLVGRDLLSQKRMQVHESWERRDNDESAPKQGERLA